MDKIVYNIIHMPNQPDSVKKALLVKVVHSSPLKNSRPLEQADVNAIFDSCVSIITTTENDATAQLAVFAFSNWAGQHKTYLKEYLTPERITSTMNANCNPVSLLAWLKEAVFHVAEDNDAICSLSPMLAEILQNKLRDCSGSSAFIAKLSDLYGACPSLLPQPHTRLTFTVMLMNCVASFPTPTKTEVLGHMKSIGGLINTLWNGLRLEDILHSLHSMYAIISNTDGGSEVCPAMAHLLSLVPTVVVEGLAPRIVSDPTTTDAAMSATLIRLTTWLVAWPTAHATLGLWVRTLVRLLYQSGRTAVPAKITLERVPRLLAHVHIPVVRVGVVTVSSTLLLSFQHSPIAFHKLIPEILNVFSRLEREGSESANAMVNRLSSLCHTLMALFPGHPDTYQPLMEVLMKYQSPSEEDIQELISEHRWEAPGGGAKGSSGHFGGQVGGQVSTVYQKRSVSQRVGLRNLGNTCYMNSVIQALFMTDSFRHAILHAVPRSNQHLLVKLQHLFSMLCFTHRTYVSPRLFHDKSRPPWFSPGMQQDCSEYLRHLMITLHEEERAGQKLPEYQERVIIESETASLASDLQPLPYDSATEDFVESESGLKINPCEDDNAEFINVIQKRKGGVNSDSNYQRDFLERHTFHDKGNDLTENAVFNKLSKDVTEYTQIETISHNSFKHLSEDHKTIKCLKGSNDVDMMDDSDRNSSVATSDDRMVEGHERTGSIASATSEAENISDASECDNISEGNSKLSSYKRKHNMIQESVHRQMPKSPKGDMTSDIDNSSDSGISGDLTEDVDLHIGSPNVSSPIPKVDSAKDGVTIEEVSSENLSNLEQENEYFVSLVHRIFGGKLATCIKCLQCKTESIHKDIFTDIHLAFQDSDQCNAATVIRRNPDRVNKQKIQTNQADLRIEDMIKNYLTSERLTGENQYECERCGGKQDAERSIQILEPPEHLILTQLRFYYDTVRNQRQKVFTNVEFGEELLLPVQYSPREFLGESCNSNNDLVMKGTFSESGVDSMVCTSETCRHSLQNEGSKSSLTQDDSSSLHSMQTDDCSTPTENKGVSSQDKDVPWLHHSPPETNTIYGDSTSNKTFTSDNCSSKNDCDISITTVNRDSLKGNGRGTESVSQTGGICRKCDYKITSGGNPDTCSCNSSVHPLDNTGQPTCASVSEADLQKNLSHEYPTSSGSSGCMTPNEDQEPVTYARYALYGVVVHSGFSSEGGHYYCYARNSSIASLSEQAKERYNALGGWYNFNDERVTSTTFSNITNLTRTFSRDTAYQLFYKKLSSQHSPEVPLIEDMKSLRLDLQEAVESDNLQYHCEQDKDGVRRKCHSSGGSHYPHDSDHDSTPPPGGCGGGPGGGGGGFNTPSRVVF